MRRFSLQSAGFLATAACALSLTAIPVSLAQENLPGGNTNAVEAPETRNQDNEGTGLGWFGLLGLAGLTGLFYKPKIEAGITDRTDTINQRRVG